MILALFFTRGVSLEKWLDTGLFDREKVTYEEHLKRGHLRTVYWFTYGHRDAKLANQLQAESRLHPSIKVIPMPRCFVDRFGIFVYSFALPLLQRRYLKGANILKTNQMDGSWSAVISKCLYCKPLVVRTGYTLSFLAKRLKKRRARIVIYKLIERLAYKHATCAVVTSKKDKRYISDIYRYPEKDIVIIPNFIDTALFKPQKVEKYPDRIVFVGRLTEQKNLFNLISAIAKTDLILDIYGKGNLTEAFENHARKQGARVDFMGIVPNNELPNILTRYNYYILPSYFEGMPKTLLEAMACGLAVIGTNVDGIREIIRNKENGMLCETDAYSIGQTIKIVMQDKNLCQRLGINARKYIIGCCNLNRILDKEYCLYKELGRVRR